MPTGGGANFPIALDVKIEQAGRAVEAIQQRWQRLTYVESPYDGVVVEQKLNLGEIVDAGKPILSVLPGMKVYVVPSTVKREEFGFIYGEIKSVASVPSTPEGMIRSLRNRQWVDQMSSGGAPFEVEASLETDPATPLRVPLVVLRGAGSDHQRGQLPDFHRRNSGERAFYLAHAAAAGVGRHRGSHRRRFADYGGRAELRASQGLAIQARDGYSLDQFCCVLVQASHAIPDCTSREPG